MDYLVTGQQILSLIPQRHPIVMVDGVLAYSADSISAKLTVGDTNIFVDEGRLQECGLLEHMAQTVAAHTGYTFFLENKPAPKGYIGAIQKSEMISLPSVGDVIETKATILQEFMGVTLVDIVSYVDGQQIATAQMKTVLATTN